MSEYTRLLASIADTITDYRRDDLPAPDAAHIERWISQFPQAARQPILAEMEFTLSKTYLSQNKFQKFFTRLATNGEMAGDNPANFWKNVKFLDIQTAGNSQREILKIFDKSLENAFGFQIKHCGIIPKSYIYIDDILFSGGRIGSDVSKWIREHAPQGAHLDIVAIGFHRLGQWFASKDITKANSESGKKVTVKWWRAFEVEDRKAYMENSDVLRPVTIPEDPLTQAYVASLGNPPILRQPGKIGELGLFSSEYGRNLLEQEFLKAGAQIREMCPLLGPYQRPLGNIRLKMVGFGSMMVTYRNCPNNAPLVFWAGDPWYPLFKRKTN